MRTSNNRLPAIRFRIFFSLCSCLWIQTTLFAQFRATGLILDTPMVRAIPHQARLIADNYRQLPASASLEQYCPSPGDQGQYATCVGFAAAYYLRTILYVKGMHDAGHSVDPDTNLFSPTFVYEQIKPASDSNCKRGSNPVAAFDLMQNTGVARLATQPYLCGSAMKKEALLESTNFKILSYQTLYDWNEPDDNHKINAAKKALSEGNPCMLGFEVAESFYRVRSPGVWKEQPSDNGPVGEHGFHAMCLIGYNDTLYGGAFRVINSWGTGWGDKGYVWIPYKEFAKYSILLISAKADPGKKTATPSELNGSLLFRQDTGDNMSASLVNSFATDAYDFSYYRMNETYSSGTRFRFFMNTNTDAYIYAFATDLSGRINQVFPFNTHVSPLLGKNSSLAFPAEDKVIRMDDNRGTDYLLVLYSKRPLNQAELLNKMNRNSGSLLTRTGKALGDLLVRPSQVSYTGNKIGFSLQQTTAGSVVPVLVEIAHK